MVTEKCKPNEFALLVLHIVFLTIHFVIFNVFFALNVVFIKDNFFVQYIAISIIAILTALPVNNLSKVKCNDQQRRGVVRLLTIIFVVKLVVILTLYICLMLFVNTNAGYYLIPAFVMCFVPYVIACSTLKAHNQNTQSAGTEQTDKVAE